MTAAERFEFEQRRRAVAVRYFERSLVMDELAKAPDRTAPAKDCRWAASLLERAADAEIEDPDPIGVGR